MRVKSSPVSHHKDDKKKNKKLFQLKKNRDHFEIFNLLRLRRVEEERVQKQEEALEAQRGEPAEDSRSEEVADKMATIRNRLTDKKRHSRERWNRFAGTSGGGGRGL